MKIINFSGNKVNGYIEYNINFNKELNFLLGINGSGKTTALKLIAGLMQPDYLILSNLIYEKIEIELLDDKNDKIKIRCDKYSLESKIKISLYVNNFRSPVSKDEFQLFSENNYLGWNDEFIRDQRASHKQIFSELETVQEIRKINSPYFLELNRRVLTNLQNDENRTTPINRRAYQKFKNNDPINNGLIQLQELVYDHIRYISVKQKELSDSFKNEIFESSFEFLKNDTAISPEKYIDHFKTSKPDFLLRIRELDNPKLLSKVNSFYSQLEKLSLELIKDKKNRVSNFQGDNLKKLSLFYLNAPQLERMKTVFDFNTNYHENIDKLYEPLSKLENLINEFYKHSGKYLSIEPGGKIFIKINGDSADIFNISSGEKQILIMIGLLIFSFDKTTNPIFMIDEPEVSLHIEWQELLVSALLKASPGAQLILATHSPSILGERASTENCISL